MVVSHNLLFVTHIPNDHPYSWYHPLTLLRCEHETLSFSWRLISLISPGATLRRLRLVGAPLPLAAARSISKVLIVKVIVTVNPPTCHPRQFCPTLNKSNFDTTTPRAKTNTTAVGWSPHKNICIHTFGWVQKKKASCLTSTRKGKRGSVCVFIPPTPHWNSTIVYSPIERISFLPK